MSVSKPVYFLLVDDLEENLISLEALLRRDGLHILKARSGPEALEFLLVHDVALALVDIQMPGMNGFELAELMRGNERTGRVPIIFLTAGTADRQRRFLGYEAGAVDFLAKPIEADILRSKADVFFQLRRQQDMLSRQRDELRSIAEENARLLMESRRYAAALQEADTRKDEFLATLAHELRNPLAPIRNGLQILRMSPGEKEAENLRDMMDRQLTHLVRLIDDLLDVSRISRGKIELRKDQIKVQDAVQAAIEISRPHIDEGHHTLLANIAENELWVEADPTRLAQVIGNLLNNAAKYTPPGGQITLSLEAQDDKVLISIADNGIGIAANMLPEIFNLFSQVDSNISRTQGGLGIGLALVRSLVEMHDGTIVAHSDGLGKGSIFTVSFPLKMAKESVVLPKKDDVSKTETAITLNVLVVDDNVPSAQTVAWMLELLGHNTVMAHSGDEALTRAREERPDVVLLDIGLPDMNGYDVCRELRRDPRFAKTRLIAQTGWGQERDRQMARDAGFDHHLVKPIKLEELNKILNGEEEAKSF